MSFFDNAFDVNDMPESQQMDFAPLPAGEYTCAIKTAEIKPTKDGTGKYVNLLWEVEDGEFARRTLFAIINIKNKSEVAEKIGKAQLGDIMRANGIATLTDTDQLIAAMMSLRVVIGEYQGVAKNEIKGYKDAVCGTAMPNPKYPPSMEGANLRGENSPERTIPAVAGKAPPWAKK